MYNHTTEYFILQIFYNIVLYTTSTVKNVVRNLIIMVKIKWWFVFVHITYPPI